ncbi:MAG: hypothetical protein IKB13_06020 [Clostridia bacterium]|nr:hypothetical protein [Clostridia bacterium]
MRYLNVPCAYCGELFAEGDDIVTCPVCGTPQHRTCWQEHGSCANAHLHDSGGAWTAPKTEEQNTNPVLKNENKDEITQCPFCGAQNYANELYCSACHEPIHPNASARAGSPLEDEEQRELMYQDFRTYGGFNPQEKVDDISVQEYASYVGGKSGGYVRRFIMMSRNRIAWNWAAFWAAGVAMISSISLGPVWFFYRKLNKIGSLFLCLLLVLGLAGVVICINDPAYWEYMEKTKTLYFDSLALAQQAGADVAQIMDDMTANMTLAVQTYAENCTKLTQMWSYISTGIYSYVLPILSGFFATGFYFKKAKTDILSVREQHGKSPDYMQKLNQKGGVSVPAAVVSAVACLAVYFLMQYLPLILRAIGIV